MSNGTLTNWKGESKHQFDIRGGKGEGWSPSIFRMPILHQTFSRLQALSKPLVQQYMLFLFFNMNYERKMGLRIRLTYFWYKKKKDLLRSSGSITEYIFIFYVAVRSYWRKILLQKWRTCLCKLCPFNF